MALARIPGHWKRYKDIAWLLVKHGRSDLVRDMAWGGEPLPETPAFASHVPSHLPWQSTPRFWRELELNNPLA